MTDAFRFIEKEFLNEDQLISKTTKTRTLSLFKEDVKALMKKAKKKMHIAKLKSLDKLLDDAYELDMYAFQFKIFKLSIQKELKNLEIFITNP